MLAEDRYKTTLRESSWKILKENLHIDHGVKYNNLYPPTMYSWEGSLNVAEMPIVIVA